jgi:hypothetical protein
MAYSKARIMFLLQPRVHYTISLARWLASKREMRLIEMRAGVSRGAGELINYIVLFIYLQRGLRKAKKKGLPTYEQATHQSPQKSGFSVVGVIGVVDALVMHDMQLTRSGAVAPRLCLRHS